MLEKRYTYFGKEGEVTWSDEDVGSLSEHEALVLFPVDGGDLRSGVKWIVAFLLEYALKGEVNLTQGLGISFLGGWVLKAHVDTHILDYVSVCETNTNVIKHKCSWVSRQHWDLSSEQGLAHGRLGHWVNMVDLVGRWDHNQLGGLVEL